ncbi:MAG: ABC transporter [Gammaproteobacteria bacterium HGW-Gammaproteobacteria-14]|nr:MAG: ABC transporter [Gammaproteobacteria bacterium HGW-Gammaproteobacteria-14]
MQDSSILNARTVAKTVPGPEGSLTLLDDITLHVNAGESVAITGPSGSGKSTLLGLLAGLDVPSRGEIRLGGTAFSSLDEDARAARRGELCGFVFQSFHLVQDLTALENVMLPLELQGKPDAESEARRWLTQVGLGERLGHFPTQLSGGEQQRVALARAFVVQPKVLFADEPTGSLDHANGERIAALLFEMNQAAGTALVLVTHDPALAQRCDRQLRLEAGRLHD